MKKIFFLIDIFCPRAFFDVNQIKNEDFYFIFNTFLITDFTADPHPTLPEYFNNPLAEAYEFEYLSHNNEAFNIAQDPSQADRIIPVPLPANAILSFTLNGQLINNNETGYLFSDDPSKLQWITRNKGSLQLLLPDDLGYINPLQFKEYNGWLISLLTDIVKRKDSGTLSLIEKDILTFATTIAGVNGDFRQIIRDEETQVAKKKDYPYVVNTFQFHKYCTLFIPRIKTEQEKKDYLPFPVKFSASAIDKLLKTPADIPARVGVEKNYRNILLQEIKKTLTPTPDPSSIARAKDVLRLFYGGGERLRIPALVPGLGTMIIKDTDNSDGKDDSWFVSNNSSLMGQVASIPLTTLSTINIHTPVEAIINAAVVFTSTTCDATQDFQSSILAYAENIRDNDHLTFKQNITLPALPVVLGDTKLNAQKTDYAPVNTIITSEADTLSLNIETNAADYHYLKIPESIFDNLSGTPKVRFANTAITGTADKFIEYVPQRMLLKRNELFKNGTLVKPAVNGGVSLQDSVSLDDFIPGIMLPVHINKVALPSKEKVLYKISRKAALSIDTVTIDEHLKDILSEISLFRTLLYNNRNTPDTGRLAIFLQLTKTTGPVILQPVDWLDNGKIDDDELIELYCTDTAIKDFFVTEKEMINSTLLLVPAGNTVDNRNEFWNKGFNSLFNKEKSAWHLALEKQYQFKFCTSVNGYARNTSLHLDFTRFKSSATTPANEIDPLIIDYTNFNKFRLTGISKTNLSKKISIHDSDASLPLIEKFSHNNKLTDPAFFYKIMHRFSETIKNNEEGWENENERYQLYKPDPSGRKFLLNGRIENQYAWRLEAPGPEIEFSYSNPIRNIATQVTQQKINNKLENNSLLQFSYEGKSIVLTLNKEYLVAVLGESNTNMTAYRDLYESFFDAVSGDKSQLVIEGWGFDNNTGQLDPSISAHPDISKEWPSIVPYLHFKGFTLIDVKPALTTLLTAPIPFLNAGVFASSDAAVLSFKVTVDSYIKGNEVLSIKIPLNADDAAKTDACHLIRVGLYIFRDPARSVNSQFNTPVTQEEISPFCLDGEDSLNNTITPFFDNPNASLNALQEFLRVHNENGLYHSFSLISAKSVVTGNLKELLGETSGLVFKPEAIVTAKTDTLLYYVPYSYKPLKVYPDLEDLTTTNAFTTYLLRVLNYLAYPERTKEDPSNFLINITGPTPTLQELFNFKLEARDYILPDVAALLAATTSYVDNRPALIENTPETWHYRNVDLLTKAMTDKNIQSAIASILTDNPLQYIDAKGFGLGLFSAYAHDADFDHDNRKGATSDLFSLQIVKDIRPVESQAGKQDTQDITKIQFKNLLQTTPGNPPAFIEILEDSLYDNEFQIINKNGRNCVQVRTAEDILENINLFDNQDKSQAPATLAHFCPDWRFSTSTDIKEYYLLPSRKPPTIPVAYISPSYFIRKQSDKDWQLAITAPATINVSFGGTSQINFTHQKQVFIDDHLQTDMPDEWKRWDVYMNTYDFIVDGDEENDFINDLYEIEIQKADPASKLIKTITISEKISEHAIFKHFDFYVRKNEKVTLPPLSYQTILKGDGNDMSIAALLKALIKNDDVVDIASSNFTLRFVGEEHDPGSKWALKSGDNTPGLIGKVMSVHMYSSQSGTNKQLLRCMVIAEPWSHFSCRLRVRRNMRDFNGDNRFDINPAFVMNSPWSPPIDYGIQQLTYNYIDEPAVAGNWNEAIKYLKVPQHVLKLDDFISASRNNSIFNMKDLFKEFFNDNKDIFNIKELINKDRMISGFIAELNNNAGLQLYNTNKKVSDALLLNRLKIDITSKAGTNRISSAEIDSIVNPFPASVKSFEPVFYIKWYSIEDPSKEVFAVAWKLKFDFFS